MRSSADARALCCFASLLLASCAIPGGAEVADNNAAVQRLSRAHAVHLPKDVESCVGVTLRLADPNGSAETIAERAARETLVSDEEVRAAMDAAGVATCRSRAPQMSAAPILVRMEYGIDPAGRVCAIVERERPEVIDPAGAELAEQAAACLRDALFRARFPAGRVKDRERIVRTYLFGADPETADATASCTR